VTKWKLFAAFGSGEPIVLTGVSSGEGLITGIIQAIEREDGSGRSWNVTVYCDNSRRTVYVRTVD
jgi:hypothetical protein